jgi:PKHD-type hydroxylase
MSILFVPDLLDAAALEELRKELESGRFVDGRRTAAGPAAEVKRNLQLEQPENEPTRAAVLLLNALAANERFRSFTLARAIRRPEFARYETGMSYGLHLDAPIQGGRPPVRADLSVTVFLSDASEYEGGELVIHTRTGEQAVKLPAGHTVVYPSDTLHRVSTVTAGERLVAVTWVQSHVRDPQMREILADLDAASARLARQGGDPEALQLLAKSRDNLLRRVAEF